MDLENEIECILKDDDIYYTNFNTVNKLKELCIEFAESLIKDIDGFGFGDCCYNAIEEIHQKINKYKED